MRTTSLRNSSLVSLLCSLLLLVSCGQRGMVNGSALLLREGRALSPDDVRIQHLVRLWGDGASCSGVLLQGDLILTAAHCLALIESEGFRIERATESMEVSSPSRVLASGIFWDEGGKFFPNFDVAWIRLSGALANVSPLPVLADSERIADAALSLVAFAKDGPGTVPVKLERYANSPHLLSVMNLELGPGAATEGGDSGSPSFIWDGESWLLLGISSGKHPILTPEAYAKGQLLPESRALLQTFVGDYVPWIEKSSGVSLNARHRPAAPKALVQMEPATSENSDFSWEGWFKQANFREASWATVHKILEQLYINGQQAGAIADWKDLFVDPTVSTQLIDSLERLPETVIGLASQKVALEDLRPLSSLPKLRYIALEDRPYRGLELLSRMPSLEKLEVKARFVGRPSSPGLGLERIQSKTLRELTLQGIAPEEVSAIPWGELDQLRVLSLKGAKGRALPSSTLSFLPQLELDELRLDNWYCEPGESRISVPSSLKVLELGPSGSTTSCL